nr:MAG: terminase large subunit [Caudoviricetes sp.]
MDCTLLDDIDDLEEYCASLSLDERKVVLSYLKQVEEYKKYNKIELFKPEPWQQRAITLGSTEPYRMACCGNRLGKSYFSTYETAIHCTGRYPKDWTGLKFNKANLNVLVMGWDWSQINRPKCTAELLLGTAEDRGSGWIPKDDIVRMVPKMGVRDTISTVYIKHYDENGIYDGDTRLTFDVYSAGMGTLMGMEIDFALMDEQVPEEIFSQVKKRLWSSRGSALYVATPEGGLDNVVSSFWNDDGVHHSGLIHVTLWESNQFTEEEKLEMNRLIEPWARPFSIEGIPSAGTGAVFAGIVKESLLDTSFEIKPHWKRMSAADLGYRDDMVFSFMALDPDTGTYYMYDEMVYSDTDAIICARGVKPLQQGYIPMILPADGDSERGLGATYRSIFKDAGLTVLNEQARNWYYDETGGDRSIKAGIIYMRELMMAGKLKIHPKCTGFLKEFSLYSYDKNGKFIDKDNNAIDSWRYCLMAIDKFGKSEKDSKDTSNGAYQGYSSWSDMANAHDYSASHF